MSRQGIILIGGGEHARVVAEAVRSRADSMELIGFVDPAADAALAAHVRYLGSDAALGEHPDAAAILAFGAVEAWRARAAAASRLSACVARWATVVHSAAWVSPTAAIGAGTVVMAGAVVQTGARIGVHCVVNSGAIVEHDVILGDNVHIAPGVVLGGGVRVGDNAYVGLGARVRDHVDIGAGALVAMGSVVVKNVSDNSSVRGVPAR